MKLQGPRARRGRRLHLALPGVPSRQPVDQAARALHGARRRQQQQEIRRLTPPLRGKRGGRSSTPAAHAANIATHPVHAYNTGRYTSLCGQAHLMRITTIALAVVLLAACADRSTDEALGTLERDRNRTGQRSRDDLAPAATSARTPAAPPHRWPPLARASTTVPQGFRRSACRKLYRHHRGRRIEPAATLRLPIAVAALARFTDARGAAAGIASGYAFSAASGAGSARFPHDGCVRQPRAIPTRSRRLRPRARHARIRATGSRGIAR